MNGTVARRMAAAVAGRVGLVASLVWLAGCGGGVEVTATMLVDNVTLIDGTDRGAQPNMAVAVDGGRIVAVAPAGRISVPATATKLDATGMYLIPGLWDNHAHLFGYYERSFPLFLANGVTTVKDVGGVIERVGYLRQETDRGRMLGPRILMAGPTLDNAEIVAAVPEGRVAVPTPAEAVKWVDSLAALKVDHLKVHSMTPRAAYFAILARARELKIPVVGHVPDSVLIQEAVDSGHRVIEHDFRIGYANSPRGVAIANWLLSEYQKYRAAKRAGAGVGGLFQIRIRAEDSVRQLYDSATAAGFAAEMARRDVWFDPTLAVLQSVHRRHEPAMRNLPELRFATKAALSFDEGLPPEPNATPEMVEKGRATYRDIAGKTFRELVRAGAKFLAGTDTPVLPLVPGFSLHRELALLVEMGLTPLQAIQAASRNAARAANRDDLGTIEEGKSADFVVLRSDPLADIANTTAVQTVVVRGRLLDRLTLDRMLRDAETFARQP
ncbi:MAG: amidohydrolase family protein [Gemmatimonadetes bacterium]|nr:amidohydrolase family protein [Gemmatimonadota bacterium]